MRTIRLRVRYFAAPKEMTTRVVSFVVESDSAASLCLGQNQPLNVHSFTRTDGRLHRVTLNYFQIFFPLPGKP